MLFDYRFIVMYIASVIPGIIVFSTGKKRLGILFIILLIGLVFFLIFIPHSLRSKENFIFMTIFLIWFLQTCYALFSAVGSMMHPYRQAEFSDNRCKSLVDKIWESGLPFGVTGPSGIVPNLFLIIMFSFFISVSYDKASGLFITLFLFLVSVVMIIILRTIPSIGKPILTLSRDGFSTPTYGFIPWQEVQGISLKKEKNRFSKIVKLIFFIPHLERYSWQFLLAEKILRSIRFYGNQQATLFILLRKSSEDPETVHHVTRDLWTKNTGLNNHWDPDLSEEANKALNRIEVAKADHSLSYQASFLQEDQDFIKKERIRIKRKRWIMTFVFILIYIVLNKYLRVHH